MKQAAVVLLFLSLIALGLCSVPLPTPPGKTLAFSWTNCGSSSDPTKLTSLSVSPDPIVLGNNITLAAAGFLSQTVTAGAGFSVSLEIYKQIFGVWVYIPCVDNVGSCTISDLCTLLKPNPNCPLKKYGIPCSCPLPQGSYTVPASDPVSIHVKNPNVSWLTNGNFEVQATVNNPSGQRMACYNIQVTLSS